MGSTDFAKYPSRCHHPHILRTHSKHFSACAGQWHGPEVRLIWALHGKCRRECREFAERTVGVEHGGHKLHDRGFVGVLFRKLQRELEGAWMTNWLCLDSERQDVAWRRLHTDGRKVWDQSQALPPSQGVSSGPKITAFHSMMFSGLGDPFTPCGGSDCSRLKSRMSRCMKVSRKARSRQALNPYSSDQLAAWKKTSQQARRSDSTSPDPAAVVKHYVLHQSHKRYASMILQVSHHNTHCSRKGGADCC